MSRVNLSETAKTNKAIVKAIKTKMFFYDLTQEKIAIAMKRTRMTVSRRFKHPGNFTLDELREISAKLHIPIEKLVIGEIQ